MPYTAQTLRTHPGQVKAEVDRLAGCIEGLLDCAETCSTCADACLDEASRRAELVECIRLDQDCADICETTARVLTRQTSRGVQVARSLLHTCIVALRTCAAECERHADEHEHCRLCAEACRRGEQACQDLLDHPDPAPRGPRS